MTQADHYFSAVDKAKPSTAEISKDHTERHSSSNSSCCGAGQSGRAFLDERAVLTAPPGSALKTCDNQDTMEDHNSTASGVNHTTVDVATEVVGWVTFAIGLPVLCLVAYTLYHMVKNDHVSPVYVINLLITDVFNFIGRPHSATDKSATATEVTSLIFYYGVITNIVFMVCIAQERYLLVARPLCFGHSHAVRNSTLISLAVWAAPLAVVALAYYRYFFWFSVCLLLPFPLFVFFCFDTCRVLSCSSSVPGEEKRRILGTLTFILVNYTVLFLPFIVNTLLKSLSINVERYHLETIARLLLYLSPVVDPLLYICMRKNARDTLKAFPCCQRLISQPEESGTIPTVSETVTVTSV